MKKNLLILIFFLIKTIFVLSQPPCTSNPLASDFCQSATPICNLNGYCGNTSSSYTNWVSTSNHTNETNTPLGSIFCASIQNNSWLKFIADSTVAIFNVWVSNCINNHGIQMQIYSTTDCYNFIPVSNCWNPLAPTNGQITAVGLIPGNVYYFMIDGTNGDVCDYVIAANIGVGSTPTITTSHAICYGDTAVLTASGGSSYLWSAVPADPTLNFQMALNSVKVKPLVNTTYSVIVTKSGSNAFCSNNIDTVYSTLTVKPVPILSLSSTKDHCSLGDGTATVTVFGGSGMYSYLWNTTPSTQTTAVATNLSHGIYSVIVTDTNACKAKDSIVVFLDSVLNPTIIGPSFFCSGSTAVLTAGNNNSSYLWSTSEITQSITVSTAGNYIVNVTKNNCAGSDTINIVKIIVPPPTINATSYICSGDTLILNAGLGYSGYHWSNNDTTQIVRLTLGGNYSVTVRDAHGCTANSSFTILQKYAPALIISSINEICNRNNGSATVTASDGVGSYSYLWNNAGNTSSISGLHQGNYNVAVSDSFCTSRASIAVIETQGPQANFLIEPDFQIFFGEPVIFSFHDYSFGSINSWQWNFGDASPYNNLANNTHAYSAVGNYNVTLIVMDTNACVDSITKIIIVRDLFTFYIPNTFTPNGDGINDFFSPKGTNVDASMFEMYIYSRWGNLLFETKNWNGESSDPWDGTFQHNGNQDKVQEGIYVYKIIVKEMAGPEHEYSGTILVIP